MRSIETQLKELNQKLEIYPKGTITTKTVKGKVYHYHRWSENGKRKEKYIAEKDLLYMIEKIEERKELETKKKDLEIKSKKPWYEFKTNVLVGPLLRDKVEPVRDLKKRELYQDIHNYFYGETQEKVLILYGLRRTGKSTLMRQIILNMSDEDFDKSAWFSVDRMDDLAAINYDLKLLESRGYKYIFIDEATFLEDFIQGAALFTDVFAECGMKIVLSGTDSLGFLFAKDEQLYDRCIMLHTTFIPYREFEEVLDIIGIDQYIQYGGTMCRSGFDYNQTTPFANVINAERYTDSAISKNIQNSLRFYQYGGHFDPLYDLYKRNELTSVINRVVEDINHRFTLEVLTKDFRSNDLGLSRNNLRYETDVFDKIKIYEVTEKLRLALEIKNKKEQPIKLEEGNALWIKEYLKLLDLIQEIEVHHLPDIENIEKRTVIAQPGLRYAQAVAIIQALLNDTAFSTLSKFERFKIQERIINEIKGRMLEDIILLETKIANPDKNVFILRFPSGEFDMVVEDKHDCFCKLFEIKHSDKVVENQYRHLVDEEKLKLTEHRYGTITDKVVLYQGPKTRVKDIQYVNIEEYLKNKARLG